MRANHFAHLAGQRIYMNYLPEFRPCLAHKHPHLIAQTVDVLSNHPGIELSNFRKLGGSTIALRYAIEDGAVSLA